MADPVEAVEERLRARPDDEALWESSLRELLAGPDPRRALTLIAEGHALLNGHDGESPACLCRACVAPDQREVTLRGLTLTRDLVVVGRRVLLFWRPEVLPGAEGAMRDAVRASLAERMRRGDAERAKRVLRAGGDGAARVEEADDA